MEPHMTRVEIEKERNIAVLRNELSRLYILYDSDNNSMAKQEYKKYINQIENRINELNRRQKYLG